MSKYLLLSPDTPMTETERKANGNKIGKFLIQSKKLRDAVIRGDEPNGTERMNRFRLLVDISNLFESDKACAMFRDFIEFQNDYKDYQKWKLSRLDKHSQPGKGASGTNVSVSEPSNPFYQNWMRGSQNASTYSSGYSNRFGIDTMGISALFQDRQQNEEEKLNYDDESDIDDFDDLDADLYYDMIERAYEDIEVRSRLCRATRGVRKFNTNIELDDDELGDNSDADKSNSETLEDSENQTQDG